MPSHGKMGPFLGRSQKRKKEKEKERTKTKTKTKTMTKKNKAGYTATLVACGWAGAVLEKVTRASGQEPYAQKAQKRQTRPDTRLP